MRVRSSMRLLVAAGLLVGSLALYGCPKRPEVVQAPPAPAGPAVKAPAAPAPSTEGSKAPEVQVTPPGGTQVQPAPVAPAPSQQAGAAPLASPLKDVFYDFDKSNIRDDQKAALNDDVAWLKGNTGAKILIEGHCDERGTAEYNLALGERRAKSTKDYLIAAGIPADRISTISYGKERPFVLGHDESAWKWNRRGHFVITGK
jgi:peptidoglycan-associated lipoprotein